MCFAIGRLFSMPGRGATLLAAFVRDRSQMSTPHQRTVSRAIRILVQTKIRTQVDSFDFLVVGQFPWCAASEDDAVVHDIGAVRDS